MTPRHSTELTRRFEQLWSTGLCRIHERELRIWYSDDSKQKQRVGRNTLRDILKRWLEFAVSIGETDPNPPYMFYLDGFYFFVYADEVAMLSDYVNGTTSKAGKRISPEQVD